MQVSTTIQQAVPPAVNAPESSLTSERIISLGLAFWGSKALLSAVELGVFTELAGRPLTCEELVRRLELDGRGWQDFLDALVSLGMLEREDGAYKNTAETALFLDAPSPPTSAGCSRWPTLASTRFGDR
jgi:hypothetical protein